MFRDVRLTVFRLATLTALAASAYELVRPLVGAACGVCVPKTALVLGGWVVPLPWLGVGSAGLLLLLSFCRGNRARRLLAALSLVTGGVALGLVLIQVVLLGSPCPICLLV